MLVQGCAIWDCVRPVVHQMSRCLSTTTPGFVIEQSVEGLSPCLSRAVVNVILQLVEWCAGDSRSAEMRYESAWRMGQWQRGAEQIITVPGRSVGTNEAILGCLKVSFSSIGHRYPLPLPLPLILHPVAPPQALLPFLTPASNPGPNPCPPLPPLVLQLSLT